MQLCGVASLFIACHALGVVAMRLAAPEQSQMQPLDVKEPPKECIGTLAAKPAPGVAIYAGLVNPKAGVTLSFVLLDALARRLNLPFNYCKFGKCFPGEVTLYIAADVPQLFSQCPTLRAIHIVRRPTSMLVSDYIYTKLNVRPEEEIRGPLHDELRQNSIQWGLQRICKAMTRYDAQLQVMRHRNQRKNILEVQIESFNENNYDNMTRSVYKHLLGSSDTHISDLVETAKKYDASRMTPSQRNSTYHASDVNQKAEAMMEVKKLFQAGDPCIKDMVKMDEDMGYGHAFPS